MGIFRIAASDQQIQHLKMKMNCDTWTEDAEGDVHTYANLIKIWYRELPAPVLQELVQCERMILCESEGF